MSPSKEELLNSEEARVSSALDTLSGFSSLHEKMNDSYLKLIAVYEKERRELFKYLGTISAGAAALSPQLLDHVIRRDLFYSAVAMLCLVVVLSTSYLISTIEVDVKNLANDLRQKNQKIYKLREPYVDFLRKSNRSFESFIKAVSSNEENIFEPKKEQKNHWYIPMDYAGEFIIWFMVIGISLLALSMLEINVTWREIVWSSVVIFIFINLISTFPKMIFQILGSPVDLVKSLVRFMVNKVKNK